MNLSVIREPLRNLLINPANRIIRRVASVSFSSLPSSRSSAAAAAVDNSRMESSPSAERARHAEYLTGVFGCILTRFSGRRARRLRMI